MDIPNVTFLSDTGGSSQTDTASKVLDKDAFMKLLVAKLSNQDPLNPMADEAFVAQLAQFSSLEQLQNMNSNLQQDIQWNYLLSQTISNTMATSLIGRTVRADSSTLYIKDGGSANIAMSLDRPVTNLTVTIRDQNGTAVRTITRDDAPAGDLVIDWDGTDDTGSQCAAGTYTVDVKATDVNGDSYTPDLFLEGTVTGVTYSDGIALLNVNGQQLPLASVLEVKEG
jgi:flagellar basal-body rod modification protein FlgD